MKTKKEIYKEIEKEILHFCKEEKYYTEEEYKSLFFENQLLLEYLNIKNLANDFKDFINFKEVKNGNKNMPNL